MAITAHSIRAATVRERCTHLERAATSVYQGGNSVLLACDSRRWRVAIAVRSLPSFVPSNGAATVRERRWAIAVRRQSLSSVRPHAAATVRVLHLEVTLCSIRHRRERPLTPDFRLLTPVPRGPQWQ
jgi:hypothetical protein